MAYITDALQRFGDDVGRRAGINIVDFPAGMRHAGRFSDAPVFVQRIVATVRVRLQDTAVFGKVPLWMDSLAVR
ncbi:hypothetical protein BBW68_00535 [Candidatus Erwinia dacicola]|uniref:Uncharacterized protein n=1 Tax=Candidatus Erwinia dacicola TaxID=252393 RepID=A0A1E7Z4Y9_9GAMM|nr:hypothetical protein BBW68_00535 [Candidatus Erwinia dacicola]